MFENLFTKSFQRKIKYKKPKDYLNLLAPVQEDLYKGTRKHISFDALKKLNGQTQILACLVAGKLLYLN